MKLIVRKRVDHGEWNNLLLSSEFGTIYQSTMYAEYLQKVTFANPLFVELRDNGELKAMTLIFSMSQIFSQRLYNSLTSLSRIFFEAFSKLKPLYWCYFGPVLFYNKNEVLKMFLQSLRAYFQFKRNSVIQLTPPPLDDNPELFLSHGFSAKQLATCIIDLRQDLQTLRKNMDKKSTWKNAQRAIRRGVQIIDVNKMSEFETYFKLLEEFRQRRRIRPYSRKEVFPIFDIMIKRNVMKCFMAVKGEKPLAGTLISVFNGYLNEWGVAQAVEDVSGHYYGSDLLRYYVIEWGHSMGYKFYDQSGLSIGASCKDLGIFRYKTKWGGKIVRYHSYTTCV
jgi:lipid II:glycine glycyltransferase (peptidoglycan interpeptide bridge formation enzyme)